MQVRLSLVELRLDGEYLVFDLLPPERLTVHGNTHLGSRLEGALSSAARPPGPSSAEQSPAVSVEHLQQLLLALVADSSSPLYSGECTQQTDISAGVWAVPSSGLLRNLQLPSAEAARAILRRARASAGATSRC